MDEDGDSAEEEDDDERRRERWRWRRQRRKGELQCSVGAISCVIPPRHYSGGTCAL